MARRKESSWWAYQDHKTKLSKAEVEANEAELAVLEQLSSMDTQTPDKAAVISVDEAISLETTRTFSLRIRKYWNI